MLLSIVVLSYNRPKQIERILRGFVGFTSDRVRLVIKDDNSPLFADIELVCDKYRLLLGVELVLHRNKSNLGYDRNLLDAFNVADTEYVFLLSDDDYVKTAKLDSLLDIIEKREEKFYFTPYSIESTGEECRVFSSQSIKNVQLSEFSSIIYNSILFSGLVYDRKSVLNLKLDASFLANCIYTQVYLAALIIFNNRSYGCLPTDVLFLGGDGVNFFGKNQSATNVELLSDRSKITSNLNYQPFLLAVIDKVSLATDSEIKKAFLSQYKIRLVSYGLRCRTLGVKCYLDFYLKYFRSKIPLFIFPTCMLFLIFFVPKRICRVVNEFGIKLLKKSG